MRTLIAEIFKLLFKIQYIKNHFFGIHKRIFFPLDLFKGVTRIIIYKKLKLFLQIDDWIQEIIYFLGDYEKAELETLKLFLQKDSVFIDIGANFGLYTLNASKLIGQNGHIISFEPFYQNFNSLKKNILLNNLKNIKIEKLAIGEINGVLKMYYDDKEKNLGMASMIQMKSGRKEDVNVVSLDSYLESKTFIKKIDLIKIDVEGFEYSALMGMQNTLITYSPSIIIEILTEKGLENSKKIHAFFERFEYKKYFIDDNGKLLSHKTNHNRLNYIFTKRTFTNTEYKK